MLHHHRFYCGYWLWQEAKEQLVEDLQARLDRSTMSIKEVKAEANRQDESCRRLRSLLSQARALLKEAGVPFMDDTSDLDPVAVDGKKTGKGNAWPPIATTLSNVKLLPALRCPSRNLVQSIG